MTQSLFWIITGMGGCLAVAGIFGRRTVYAIFCQTALGILFSFLLAIKGQAYASFVVFALNAVLFAFLLLFSLKAGEGEIESVSLSLKARCFIVGLMGAALSCSLSVLCCGVFFFQGGRAKIRPVQMVDVGRELFENNSHLLWLTGVLLVVGCVGVSILLSALNDRNALQETNEDTKNVGQ